MPDFESWYQEAGYDNWDDYEANDFRDARYVAEEEARQQQEMEEAIEEARTAEKVASAELDEAACCHEPYCCTP